MNQRPQINRRDFLRMAAVGAAGATLAACAGAEPATPEAYGVPADSRRIVFNRYDQPAAGGQAVYVYADDPVIQLDLGQEFPRNEHQLAGLRAAGLALPAADPLFGATLGWAYREYAVQRLTPPADGEGQGGPLGDAPVQMVDRTTRDRQLREVRVAGQAGDTGTPRLCLFNVLVALEWAPDAAYLRQLEWAFRRASDFLYDATDGSMAFGQVVFGGPELMDAADIQIMASNRLLPRSWVSGLHLAAKYMPIRIGRGVWNDRNRVSIPWDEPEAYRTLVHEWGHYALELR
ncbi:MAG: twin-arginine translocation signal domain-containing protein, partial [Roseiflexaceae bacterium]